MENKGVIPYVNAAGLLRPMTGVQNINNATLLSVALNAPNGELTAANGDALASQTSNSALMVASPGEWAGYHTPIANTIATITRPAAEGYHVCRSISASLIGLAIAAETTVLLNLFDGMSGVGTVLWSMRLLVSPLTTGGGTQNGIAITGLNIVGTFDTPMTLEFNAAGGANTFESVAFTGYTAT